MAEKNYIGSQQHWEDSINADYDESERRYKEQVDNREQIDDREPQYTTPPDKVEGGKEGVDEEAIRIRDLFWYDRDSFIQRDEAKKSALTHCDLMIDAFKRHDPNYHTMSYWHPIDHYENLKAAINKL